MNLVARRGELTRALELSASQRDDPEPVEQNRSAVIVAELLEERKALLP